MSLSQNQSGKGGVQRAWMVFHADDQQEYIAGDDSENDLLHMEATEDREIVGIQLVAELPTTGSDASHIWGMEVSFSDVMGGTLDRHEPVGDEGHIEPTKSEIVASIRGAYTDNPTAGVIGGVNADSEYIDLSENPITWERNETLYLHGQKSGLGNGAYFGVFVYYREV